MFVRCELNSTSGKTPEWYVTGNFVGCGNKSIKVKAGNKQDAIKKGMDALNKKY